MTPTPRDIIAELRQGRLIMLADETGVSLACDPGHEEAVQQLLDVRKDLVPAPLPTILITDSSQLNLYIRPIPDVAWDLIDFAETPLTVLLSNGVNLPEAFRAQVPVRKTLSDSLRKLLIGFGRGLLTLPFEDADWPVGLAKPAISWGESPPKTQLPRIMELGPKGEVAFLRK